MRGTLLARMALASVRQCHDRLSKRPRAAPYNDYNECEGADRDDLQCAP